jgi:phosphoglycolate phosphatase-like HAD superfamily hydrolase
MIHPSFLHALANKFSLGIVTGRPRKDADEFLNRFQIRNFFGNNLFCMEDGDAKPSPVGIQKVLHKLKINPSQVYYMFFFFLFFFFF